MFPNAYQRFSIFFNAFQCCAIVSIRSNVFQCFSKLYNVFLMLFTWVQSILILFNVFEYVSVFFHAFQWFAMFLNAFRSISTLFNALQCFSVNFNVVRCFTRFFNVISMYFHVFQRFPRCSMLFNVSFNVFPFFILFNCLYLLCASQCVFMILNAFHYCSHVLIYLKGFFTSVLYECLNVVMRFCADCVLSFTCVFSFGGCLPFCVFCFTCFVFIFIGLFALLVFSLVLLCFFICYSSLGVFIFITCIFLVMITTFPLDFQLTLSPSSFSKSTLPLDGSSPHI